MTEIEYRTEKERILSLFSHQLIEGGFLYDPEFSYIVELLIRGENPYKIIENLIKDRRRIYDEMIKALNNKK